MKRRVLIVLAVLILIQFFRPEKNLSAAISSNDITKTYPVPDSVLTVLKRSCYDCHSNNTVYPWYFNIQPVAWWMQYHVNHGKRALDFSEFGGYTGKRQYDKLRGIAGILRNNGMPLDSYLWIHKDAKLSDRDKNMLIRWADSLRMQLPGSAPGDQGSHPPTGRRN